MKNTFRAISVCICLILFLSAAIVIGNIASAQSGSWTTKAPMPEAREQSASAAFGGLFYIFGGSSSTVPEVYDPLSNSWSTRAPDSTGRCDMADSRDPCAGPPPKPGGYRGRRASPGAATPV